MIGTGSSKSPFRWVNTFFCGELLEAKLSPSVFSLMESHAHHGLPIPSVPHKSQLRLLAFLLLLLLYIHIQKCQRCPICRLDVTLGLLGSWDPLEDAALLAVTWAAAWWGTVPSTLPWPVPACTHVFTSLCCYPRKFKPRVKFIVSISFILSIVLHFIICCDILNGACHSILTTARGYSHLLCQAFRQP